MGMLCLIVICLAFGAISASDSSIIERQNNDNYDSLSKYRPTESSSSFGGSQTGGYYPRNYYEDINQNRFNADLNGKEFRPPNVFAVPLLSTPTPYSTPLLAQPRQFSMSGGSGLMPYQMNSMSPLMQSPGYPMGGSIGSQFPGYNYGGVPTRLGGAGQGFGLLGSEPYGYGYGIGGGAGRQPLGFSQPNSMMNPYSMYSTQGLYGNPYSSQGMGGMGGMGGYYSNPGSGYLNSGFGSYMSPQFGGNPYQSQSFMGQLGYSSGLGNQYSGLNTNNNNNYNSNSGLGSGYSSGQSGINESNRSNEERNYASSASTKSEAHSGPQSPLLRDEFSEFQSNRIVKKSGIERNPKNRPFVDYRTQ